MKFIQLDILNLASLDRPTGETINFEEGVLGDSTIFSIVGPTGSGKSTILDAICLALYNRAPRYPRKKGERNQNIVIYGEKEEDEKNRPAPTEAKNILTKGRKHGYSKLTFLANNGMIYRAEWHVHFNRKNYTEPENLLYRISGDNGHFVEEPADWNELPQIIGLEYDQFLHTVLIAQGSFANFLNAKEEDRYRLLEKLVGCEDMYVRIANEIKQKKEEADASFKAVETSLSSLKDDLIASPDELQQLVEKISALEVVEARIKEEIVKVTEALTWHHQEATYTENIKKYQEQLSNALSAIEAAKADFGQLSLHDATLPAVALYDDAEDCTREISQLQASQQQLELQRQQQEEKIRQEEQRLVGLKEAAQKAQEEIEKLKPYIDRARTLKGELALVETLHNKDTEQKELSRLQKRDQEMTVQLSELNIEALDKEVKTLHSSYALLTSENLEHCRQQLVDGEPCPLCGATHHPYRSEATFSPVVSALNELLKDKENQLKQQMLKQQKLFKEQGEAKGRMKELSNHIHQFSISAEKLQKELAFNVSVLTYNNAKDEVLAKTASLKAEIGEQDPDQLETSLNQAKTHAETAVNKQIETLGRLRESLEGVKGSLKTTEERKKVKEEERATCQKQLTAWLEDYNAQHDTPIDFTLIAQLYASKHNWEAIRKKLQELNAAHTSAEAMLTSERQKHAQHQAKKPADSQEALLEKKTRLDAHSNAELIEAKMRLEKHVKASEKAGALQEELMAKTKIRTEWSEIYDAIGADGKTLRKIAQCYTLRFLVEHANAEIRKFNNRYELVQVRNSLGLRVIDHDRADDVRDITSLSGGETFIVSLGLALGLSSLSSRSISFENLFIDEGFGTLDPDTLATVIDSLSMLQTSQGKKVGVISHTDTMSERITTQIRIIKNGSSGSSHIEIYP